MMHRRFVVTAAEVGRPLDKALQAWCGEDVSRSQARRALQAGQVLYQGKAAGPNWLLRRAGDVVEWVDASPAARAEAPFLFGESHILFRDEHLLAVNKPAGLLTHPSADLRRPDLVSSVREYLGEGAELTLQHRLDRETSGLILFTLSEAARGPVARLFAERGLEKCYRAWSGPLPHHHPHEWVIRHGLQQEKGRIRVGEGGLEAETHFRVLRKLANATLLEVVPKTGRKHQIRVHLASRGLPIWGDVLYGGPPHARLLLHAYQLSLPHPITGKKLKLVCPEPADFGVRPPRK